MMKISSIFSHFCPVAKFCWVYSDLVTEVIASNKCISEITSTVREKVICSALEITHMFASVMRSFVVYRYSFFLDTILNYGFVRDKNVIFFIKCNDL